MVIGFPEATAVVAFDNTGCHVELEGEWTQAMMLAMERTFETEIHKRKVAGLAARHAKTEVETDD